MEKESELKKRNILRQNNAEANALTRECIEAALILLMKEKSFQSISITDITKKAGVSRTAYYRNYDSKEAILANYLQNINNQISSVLLQFNPITDTYDAWIALLTAANEFSAQYKLLLQAGYGEIILTEYKKSINHHVDPNDYALYYSNCYWAGAIHAILTEWIKNDMNIPIPDLAKVGSRLMLDGIHSITEYGNSCD